MGLYSLYYRITTLVYKIQKIPGICEAMFLSILRVCSDSRKFNRNSCLQTLLVYNLLTIQKYVNMSYLVVYVCLCLFVCINKVNG